MAVLASIPQNLGNLREAGHEKSTAIRNSSAVKFALRISN